MRCRCLNGRHESVQHRIASTDQRPTSKRVEPTSPQASMSDCISQITHTHAALTHHDAVAAVDCLDVGHDTGVRGGAFDPIGRGAHLKHAARYKGAVGV